MSVRKNPRGPGYEVRLRVNGERRSRIVRTAKQAETLERQWKDEQLARRVGLPVEREPMTYDTLCDRYLAQHQQSSRTLRTLRERLLYSRAAFGPVLVHELLTEEITAWNAALPVGPTTRRNALIAMRQVLRAGVAWKRLPDNPASEVKLPKPATTEIQPFESWAEVSAVANAAEQFGGAQASALIWFACATGLRPQEWQALRWQDLDLPGRVGHVRQTVRDGRIEAAAKTDGSLRAVRLQALALIALDLLPRPLDRTALVFCSPEGHVINLSNWRRRVWFPALDAAGLSRRRIYDMRHTFATLALAAPTPIEWIASQMGHRDTRVTQRHYTRWLPAADERWLRALDAFGMEQGGRDADAQADA